ncbi:hypothetical protein A8C32_03300 [Flavivirga aquatica]|uniref:DUF4082 domain-containing protein n=1 Tax=Flavivirga aquatica TaxID=1849968 RepID=A0A1E5TAV6_9FLAO|nr:DUF4082 domain-containing protein [Flavivirga aquatica]OEK08491.1 hypothetical protein A8C32_03300 [Flavivirga aquatica]
MKMQKLILGLIFLGILFISCSKNDDEISIIEEEELAPQYPMKSVIESGHMQVNYQKVDGASTFEIGYKFKSFKNGKITALGIRVPNNDVYRVTLWNVETETILTTANITSSSGLLSFKDIEPININSGITYFVSVNTNDYYQFTNSGNDLFPVESEDIIILAYGSNFGTSQTLPVMFSKVSYLGVVDVKFIPSN